MKKLISSLIGILLCSVAINAMAVQVSDLYQTTVPVASQDRTLQATALQQALSQVLIKVSGNSGTVKLPAVKTAITNPEKYLLTYSYQDGVLPDGNTSLLLAASFDPKAIQTVLTNAQQNIWGKTRPLVLVWLADTKNNTAAELIGANSQNPITAQFSSDAKTRGLPILFPMMDLTDIKTVSPADVTAAQLNTTQLNAIQQASTRYSSDAILVVNLTQNSSSQWNGSWTLISQGEATTWQTNGMSLDAAIKAGIDSITDNLAAKFAVVANTTASPAVQLTVMNVQSLADYAAVTKYLKGLALAKQVEVNQVNAASVIFDLTVAGGEAALQQALSLDHHLEPVTAAPNSTNSATGLVYQWVS